MTIVYTNKNNVHFADISYHDQTPVDFDIMGFPFIRSSRLKFSADDSCIIQRNIFNDSISTQTDKFSIPVTTNFTKLKISPAIIGPDMIGFRVTFDGYFSLYNKKFGLVGYINASRWYKTPRDLRNACESYSYSPSSSGIVTVQNYIDYMKNTNLMIHHPNAHGIDRSRAFAKWKTLLKTP